MTDRILRSPHLPGAWCRYNLVRLPQSSSESDNTDMHRLVATLGSNSIARKLNRKAIQDVDVPKACDVIVNPEAPMALRLQGSLL